MFSENDFNSDAFTSSHIQLLQLLCGQAALSIDNARLYSQLSSTNAHLQQLLVQRTSELETLQQAMDAAEKAMKIKSEFLANMSALPTSARTSVREEIFFLQIGLCIISFFCHSSFYRVLCSGPTRFALR